MGTMGLARTQYWASWFLVFLATFSVSVLAVVVTLFAGNVLRHSSSVLVFLFLELYAVACITFAFAVSACFHHVRAAARDSYFLKLTMELFRSTGAFGDRGQRRAVPGGLLPLCPRGGAARHLRFLAAAELSLCPQQLGPRL